MKNANPKELEKLEKRLNRELEQLKESDPVKQRASLDVIWERTVSLKSCRNLPTKFLRSYTTELLNCQANVTVPQNKKLLENVLRDLPILVIAGSQRENATNMKFIMSIHDDSVGAMLGTQAFIENLYKDLCNARDRAKQAENAQKQEVGVKKKKKFVGFRVRLTPHMKKCISSHKQRRRNEAKQTRKEQKRMEQRRSQIIEKLKFYKTFLSPHYYMPQHCLC